MRKWLRRWLGIEEIQEKLDWLRTKSYENYDGEDICAILESVHSSPRHTVTLFNVKSPEC